LFSDHDAAWLQRGHRTQALQKDVNLITELFTAQQDPPIDKVRISLANDIADTASRGEYRSEELQDLAERVDPARHKGGSKEARQRAQIQEASETSSKLLRFLDIPAGVRIDKTVKSTTYVDTSKEPREVTEFMSNNNVEIRVPVQDQPIELKFPQSESVEMLEEQDIDAPRDPGDQIKSIITQTTSYFAASGYTQNGQDSALFVATFARGAGVPNSTPIEVKSTVMLPVVSKQDDDNALGLAVTSAIEAKDLQSLLLMAVVIYDHAHFSTFIRRANAWYYYDDLYNDGAFTLLGESDDPAHWAGIMDSFLIKKEVPDLSSLADASEPEEIADQDEQVEFPTIAKNAVMLVYVGRNEKGSAASSSTNAPEQTWQARWLSTMKAWMQDPDMNSDTKALVQDLKQTNGLSSLDQKTFLNDTVMNFYRKVVQRLLPLVPYHKNIFLLSSHFISAKTGNEAPPITEIVRKAQRELWKTTSPSSGKKLPSIDAEQAKDRMKLLVDSDARLFFPYNLNSVHWILVVVSLKSRTASIYDSLQRPQYSDLESKLNAVFEELLGGKLKVISAPSVQQTNGYDCGVYTCHNMAKLALHKVLSKGPDWQESASPGQKKAALEGLRSRLRNEIEEILGFASS